MRREPADEQMDIDERKLFDDFEAEDLAEELRCK
jgi:hypothetical protein